MCGGCLQVGNIGGWPGEHAGMSINRQQSQFVLWAIMKAPLLISTDLRTIDKESLRILLLKEVIAVNQDPLGVAGDLIFQQGPAQVRSRCSKRCRCPPTGRICAEVECLLQRVCPKQRGREYAPPISQPRRAPAARR